jgi:hypothetical protein
MEPLCLELIPSLVRLEPFYLLGHASLVPPEGFEMSHVCVCVCVCMYDCLLIC